MKFRVHPVALTADVEKAFLQIQIKPDDRDMLRFLWLDDVTLPDPCIVQFRFCRLPFGLRPSPSILGGTVRKHLENYQELHPDIVEILKELYVDDLSSGADTIEKALEIYVGAKEIMKQAGLNLRKWNGNSKELLAKIKELENESNAETITKYSSKNSKREPVIEDDQSFVKASIGQSGDDKASILGLNWDTDSDEIYFEFEKIVDLARKLPLTKRSVLKLSAKIFDPLGFLSVFTINLKILFQVLCTNKVDWDEELQGPIRFRFMSLISDLGKISNTLRIPRCYFTGERVKTLQFHGFSDASELAYAGVLYLRVEYEIGNVDVRFVSSKSKVAPIKKQTIPRLELMSAKLLAKLVNMVRNALLSSLTGKAFEIIYWVDSLATLCWIQNQKPWKQFVMDRVKTIRQLSNKDQWRFCPGALNLADLPTCGKYGKSLPSNKLWREGPEFLKKSRDHWPENLSTGDVGQSVALEEQVKNLPSITYTLTSLTNPPLKACVLRIIDIDRFGKKSRLIRTVAWVFRFIRNLRAKIYPLIEKINTKILNASELRQAENLLIISVQDESFTKELNYLMNPKKGESYIPPIHVTQFNLYVDEQGVLRSQTRVTNASLPETNKNPILLPTRHPFTKLVIKEYHEKVYHNGVHVTLTAIRQNFWILMGREAVKSVVKGCVTCKK